MKRTRLQLHITPQEVIDLANSIKKEFKLYMVIMSYQPFSVKEKKCLFKGYCRKWLSHIILSKPSFLRSQYQLTIYE